MNAEFSLAIQNATLTWPIRVLRKEFLLKEVGLKSTGEPLARSSRHKGPLTKKKLLELETSKTNE